jgi:hypothetical protein
MWNVESSTTAPPQPISGPTAFRVKYVCVFVVYGWRRANGPVPDGIVGYFSTMVSSGEFSTAPGPIKRIALVQ